MNELLPVAGATKTGRCPKTVLTADAGTLAVTDHTTGHAVRATPAALYHYRYDQGNSAVQGLAALDADGLVLLDLPGDWHAPHLRDFADRGGIPLVDARDKPSAQVRAALACRAPGWRRLHGLARPFLTRWRRTLAVCAGVVGLGVMAYFAYAGLWMAWRGLASFGRLLLDVVEAKWLWVAFSPALLIIRPVVAKLHRLRVRQGAIVGPPEGPYLVGKRSGKLEIIQRNEVIAGLRLGEVPGQVFSLLVYRYEDLTGLFVLDRTGRPLHHLPGRWSPDEADRFAKRHDLRLAVHRLSREEYSTLARSTEAATP